MEAVPAASTIVLRGEPFEILLLRRHERSTFVPGSWVFPGGAVDPADHVIARKVTGEEKTLDVMRVCALRELFEETGLWSGVPPSNAEVARQRLLSGESSLDRVAGDGSFDLDALVWTARWITPTGIPKRFDTWFFLLPVSSEVVATVEGSEGVELAWIRPAEALERHRRGELPMVFPTIRNLQAIADFDSAGELIAARRGATIKATRPRLVVEGAARRIVLPDDE